MASTSDFKNGLVLNLEGQLWTITEFQHVKPGKGPAFVRTTLKNVMTGKVVDKTFNAGVKVDTATVDKRDMTFLYKDGADFVFMDGDTYDQITVPAQTVGDVANFLLENQEAMVAQNDGVVLYVELPASVELLVSHTDPGPAGRPVDRRHQAGHPGNRRRDQRPAVPEHRRQDQGRHPRRPVPRPRQQLTAPAIRRPDPEHVRHVASPASAPSTCCTPPRPAGSTRWSCSPSGWSRRPVPTCILRRRWASTPRRWSAGVVEHQRRIDELLSRALPRLDAGADARRRPGDPADRRLRAAVLARRAAGGRGQRGRRLPRSCCPPTTRRSSSTASGC